MITEVELPLPAGVAGGPPRLRLDDGPITQRSMLATLMEGKRYEPVTMDLLVALLRPGDWVMDIGAHVGLVTVLAASRVGPKGGVVAVEPDVANLAALRANVALNGFEDRVRMVAGVAADSEGEREIHLNRDNDGGHALWRPGLHPFNERTAREPLSRRVAAVTLDGLNDRFGPLPVKLVKIDTEGAEQLVLSGGRRLLGRRLPPYVLAELNPFGLEAMGCSQVTLRTMMEDLGYATFLPRGAGLPAFVPPGILIEWTDYVGNVLFAKPGELCRVWPVLEAAAGV
ncbi:MAG: FkbM family methyltransferase [Rhodospirillum sp.]|nr:FkbM family methyltransferase [Rhodospirillum sp.]MCF8489784.1 FkbM family methyltransferase [Rhodospirillum sp.]MCF8500496.1 FkbM family methyltransferase [Rhodospirillum sp.]